MRARGLAGRSRYRGGRAGHRSGPGPHRRRDSRGDGDERAATLAGHVWAEGETSWADLVSAAAGAAGVRLAIVEAGTTGTLGALLAEFPALERSISAGPGVAPDPAAWPVEEAAVEAARSVGVAVGVALVALTVPGDGTRLRAAVVAPDAGVSRVLDVRLFQHGAHGRFRAAVAATAFTIEVLRTLEPAASTS